ncbi:glycoside hydrolase family 9 protein [Neolewinella lacunae]|uniref:Endoglucanase n=1 Tax=Neolewinella lacunae TaxID=1517758 RepID=A0A923TAH1_9BACT|nr:glycoside hydrolase family 9 protein [Neolewinella lacunae]MBC6996521.1 glycoside hydrolase family 9 protein [Neolewinella lacunae]MDN3634914.1 glycoside hydrolase family 9 protein [Neolewinella lacunae]
MLLINFRDTSGATTKCRMIALLLGGLFLGGCGTGKPVLPEGRSEHILVNQVGYLPGASAQIILTQRPEGGEFYLMDSSGAARLATLPLALDSLVWPSAGQTVWPQEITAPRAAGHYRFLVPGLGYSAPFAVGDAVYQDPFLASVKALYYQRASTALPERYAGKWQRPLGHPDTAALYHPSSGKEKGTLDSPKGWYDAGDYNKYVVNGAFPLGQYFALYEDIGDPVPDGQLNIPESDNGVSDYLDEMRWEMDWLLTMQDDDGGLFHKLTTKEFEAMVMPHEARRQRYVVGKGTAATLNFAAAAAQGARIFADIDSVYAADLVRRAEMAWAWALLHPAVAYTNPADIKTGEYGDKNFTDEWYWAGAELFVTTGKAPYLAYLRSHPAPLHFKGGSWTSFMGLLGCFSLLRHPEKVPAEIYAPIRMRCLEVADSIAATSLEHPYRLPMTKFAWGSNSDLLNAAMVTAAAYQLSPEQRYLQHITDVVDYVLGKNPTGYSFLTGFGSRSPMFIHHRQSAADGIAEPVPGLLSGGPNSGQQDRQQAQYPPDVAPMKSWVDQQASYASNEIALNWNAPLSYILAWVQVNR